MDVADTLGGDLVCIGSDIVQPVVLLAGSLKPDVDVGDVSLLGDHDVHAIVGADGVDRIGVVVTPGGVGGSNGATKNCTCTQDRLAHAAAFSISSALPLSLGPATSPLAIGITTLFP